MQLTLHGTINICNFAMLFLHVFAPGGHPQGGSFTKEYIYNKCIPLCISMHILDNTEEYLCLNTF